MPLISIIIPVYNVASFLNYCLDSVLNQIFADYECIIIDDGSTDDSPIICDYYSLKDNRIKVIHKINCGLSDARNTGILNSTGKYIVLLDSDDALSSIKSLLNLSIVIDKTNADVIFNSILTTFINNDKMINNIDQFFGNHEYYNPTMFYKCIMHNNNSILAGWLFTLKRDFLLKNNLFFKTGIFHEDELWIPFVICSADRIAINHNPFYSYRINRKNSIMSELTPNKLFDKQIIIDDLQLYKNKVKKQVKFIIDERCIILWNTIFDEVFSLERKHDNENKKITIKLNKQKKVLLYRKNIKNYIFFLILLILGIKYTFFLREKKRNIFKSINKIINKS
jgi:glycosyltransferase involved in cell wall biosynthesis